MLFLDFLGLFGSDHYYLISVKSFALQICNGIFFPFQVNGTEIEYDFEEITLERVSLTVAH